MYYYPYLSVDGGWNDYEDWSPCSEECGEGTRVRSRSCSNPAPSNGGKECEGDSHETESCNTDPCPGIPFDVVIKSIKYI